MTAPALAPDRVSRRSPEFGRDRVAHAWILVRALSDAGDAAWSIALAWTAVQVASPAAAGAVVAAGTLPRAAVLLLGGAIADRFDTRRVLLAANLARVVVLVACVCWIAAAGTTYALLLVVAVLFGVCDALHEPAASTVSRQLIHPSDLPAYSGASQTASRVGTMAGAAAGGFLVAFGGLTASALLNAATFGLVVVFVAVLLVPRYRLERAPAEPLLRGIVRGVAHLRDAPATRTLVLSLSGLNLAVAPALGLGLSLRASDADWGAGTVGVVEAMVGLGAALGAIGMMRWKVRRPALVGLWCLVAQGACIALLGVGTPVSTAAVAALLGVTAGIASALLSAVFVATVDGAYFGRTVALTRLGDDVLMPLAMMTFGLVAGAWSVTTAYVVFGGAMSLLMLLPLANPVLRGLTLSDASDDGNAVVKA